MGKEAKFAVRLMPDDRRLMKLAIAKMNMGTSKGKRVLILLLTDEGGEGPAFTDDQVALMVGVNPSTVYRVRKRFATKSLAAALDRRDAEPRDPGGSIERKKRMIDFAGSVYISIDGKPAEWVPITLLPPDLNDAYVDCQLFVREAHLVHALGLEYIGGH